MAGLWGGFSWGDGWKHGPASAPSGRPCLSGPHAVSVAVALTSFEPRRFLKGKEPGVGKKIIFSLNGHIDACPEYLVSVKV